MLCVLFFCVFLWEKEHWGVVCGVLSFTKDIFSLTELTDVTDLICAQFRAHRTPPAYRVHRALLPKVAVRFCEIGWLNVSVGLCMICSSVFFCEKKNTPTLWDDTQTTRWGGFSLTLGRFISHRAHRVNRAFLRTVSNSQKASGIQISQSVTAKDRYWMLSVRCWWLAKERHQSESIFPSRHKQRRRGISVITPLSIRRGAGGEASLGCNALCYRLT